MKKLGVQRHRTIVAKPGTERSIMHISYVLGYLSDRYGGPPKSTWGLGEFVKKHDVRVSYWATANNKERTELACLGSNVHLYDTVWPRGWFHSPELGRNLAKKIKNIDLLHIQEIWSYPQYIATKLATHHDKPFIVTPRGLLEPWKFKVKVLKKHGYLRLIGKHILKSASCLHAVTPFEVAGFRKAGYKGSVTIIPNGVDPDIYANMPAKSEAESIWPELTSRRVVLFLARVGPEKGLSQLIPAWANLTKHRSYNDALLVIAGPDHQL